MPCLTTAIIGEAQPSKHCRGSCCKLSEKGLRLTSLEALGSIEGLRLGPLGRHRSGCHCLGLAHLVRVRGRGIWSLSGQTKVSLPMSGAGEGK